MQWGNATKIKFIHCCLKQKIDKKRRKRKVNSLEDNDICLNILLNN